MPAGATSIADHLVLHLAASRKLARYLLRNEADAEDVVQEAYARALRYRQDALAGDSLAWMLAIVRNVGYDCLRHRQRISLRSVPMDLEQTQADTPSPEAILAAKLNAESIHRSLARLPTHQRRVVILRDLEQMPYKEIAKRDEIPIGTVMSRLARGRANLRALLATRHCTKVNGSQLSEKRSRKQ